MSTNELTLTPSESPSLVNKLSISPTQSLGAVRRPVNTTGWREWLFTVDHKKLGIMYGAVAFVFFIVGGVEALFIRLQLALPDGRILSADKYNQMFHARNDDDLPLRHAYGSSICKLFLATSNWCSRRCLPTFERLVVLVIPQWWSHSQRIMVPWRSC